MARKTAKDKDDGGKRSELVGSLTVNLLVALISIALTYGLTQYGGRVRVLEYYAPVQSGVFNRPDLKDLKILVKNLPVQNLSTVGLSLYNRTDQDYENVELLVDFVSSDGYQFSLLQLTEEDSVPNVEVKSPAVGEARGPSSRDSVPANVTDLHFHYNLKVANRSTNEPIFKVDYIFASVKAPTMRVRALKKGLAVAEITPASEGQARQTLYYTLLCAVAILLTVWLLVSLLMLSEQRTLRKHTDKLVADLEGAKLRVTEAEKRQAENTALRMEVERKLEEVMKREAEKPKTPEEQVRESAQKIADSLDLKN
jgi:hypothetical protein